MTNATQRSQAIYALARATLFSSHAAPYCKRTVVVHDGDGLPIQMLIDYMAVGCEHKRGHMFYGLHNNIIVSDPIRRTLLYMCEIGCAFNMFFQFGRTLDLITEIQFKCPYERCYSDT